MGSDKIPEAHFFAELYAAANNRFGDEERTVMHLVPAAAVTTTGKDHAKAYSSSPSTARFLASRALSRFEN